MEAFSRQHGSVAYRSTAVAKMASTGIVWISLVVCLPSAVYAQSTDIALGRANIEAYTASSESVFCGQFEIEINQVTTDEPSRTVSSGVYTFDLRDDLASFDQLNVATPMFWMKNGDGQFVHVGRSENRRVKIYPREMKMNVSQLELNFDIRSLPILAPANIETLLPSAAFVLDSQVDEIVSVVATDANVEVVVGSKYKTALEAVEAAPSAFKQQILSLIKSGVAESELPFGRARSVFVFDTKNLGRLTRYETLTSPFGGEEWQSVAVNKIEWQELSGFSLPSNVTIEESSSDLTYEIAMTWKSVNTVAEDAFELDSVEGLQGMVVVDTRFQDSVEIGVVGPVAGLENQ